MSARTCAALSCTTTISPGRFFCPDHYAALSGIHRRRVRMAAMSRRTPVRDNIMRCAAASILEISK